jgi:hypothetical protein
MSANKISGLYLLPNFEHRSVISPVNKTLDLIYINKDTTLWRI